jgi:hypothetical protein
VAEFETTGKQVECGGVIQSSGVSINDFTDGAMYRVTAGDCTTKDYSVTVSVGIPDPVLVKRFDTSSAYDLEIQGDYAFVADGGQGLCILDVSDPLNPQLVDSIDTDWAFKVKIRGSYAYVTDSSYGLLIMRL